MVLSSAQGEEVKEEEKEPVGSSLISNDTGPEVVTVVEEEVKEEKDEKKDEKK